MLDPSRCGEEYFFTGNPEAGCLILPLDPDSVAFRCRMPGYFSSHLKTDESARDAILEFARKALDRKVRYVSDDTPARLGPDSYDCSGFVGKAYEAAGLGYTTYGGGIPNVEALLQDTEVFERIDLDQARPGDLVVHLGVQGERANHIGIFTRNESGTVFEISALTRGRAATRDRDSPDFKSSVIEHPAHWIGNNPMILRWRIK